MTNEQTTFLSDVPDSRDEQWRAQQVVLYNWGTLSKLHVIDVPYDGLLITGPSGAGKSTILDAIAILLTPPRSLRMNAAAQQENKRDADRSRLSYIRGAWGTTGDESQAQGRKQYLREGATWSALALRLGNRLGRVTTLVRLFWVTGSGSNSDVHSHQMVIDGPFDLESALSGFTGDIRKLKASLNSDSIRHHDTFEAYRENFCRRLSISDDEALVLLHRTQSLKNLDSLDAFLREFMLDNPPTFEIADRLVAEFSDLDEAHRAVVAARRQIEILAPAKAQFAERDAARARMDELRAMQRGVDGFVAHLEVSLRRSAISNAQAALQVSKDLHAQKETEVLHAAERLQHIEALHRQAGGSDVADLERRKAEAVERRNAVSERRARLAVHAKALGMELAEDPVGFAEQAAEARARIADAQAEAATREAEREQLTEQRIECDQSVKSLLSEVQRLEASNSNIPDRVQAIRDRLCESLSIPVAQLPFVGELIQVKADEVAEWAPAIERLLHGFALTLLVPEKERRRVARWVNENNLRGKLVYDGVDTASASPTRDAGPDSVLSKLDRKSHPFAGAVYRQLLERFNYRCVSSAVELAKIDFSITREGQIRHGRGRTEKDDRFDYRNRKYWVLGFDSREKLALLREALSKGSSQLLELKDALQALKDAAQGELLKLPAATAIADTAWKDIDVLAAATMVHGLETRISELLKANPDLANLDAQRIELGEQIATLKESVSTLATDVRLLEKGIGEHEKALQTATVTAGAVTTSEIDALRARLPDDWSPSLDAIKELPRTLDQAINADLGRLGVEVSELGSRVETAFRDFLREWPTEAGSLQPILACADDFFVKLSKVEADGLPVHEQRFRDLLRTQSHERLAELNKRIGNAMRDITSRLEDVNEALHPVDYHPGTYIRLHTIDLRLPDPVEFRRRLAEQFSRQSSVESDPVAAEAQFRDLKVLVDDLRRDNPARAKWRELVLDVRRHVGFFAIERERRTDNLVDRYDNADGKSGGQRQKLTTTCLAAALRYKLGGVDQGVSSFGMVVLDEAFSGADPQFTRTCLEVFTTLGFQIVLATPLSKVMAIEPFVAGAVHVSIKQRNRTQLLAIDYDLDARRLILPDALAKDVAAHEDA